MSAQRRLNPASHPRRNYPDFEPLVEAHCSEPRVSSHRLEPRVGPYLPGPRVSSYRLEPHVDSYRSEPRVGSNRIYDTGRDFGRGAQSTHSSPPSPTPLSRGLPRKLSPPPLHQGLGPPTPTRSHNHPPAETIGLAHAVPNHLDLGDIYYLDESYVRLRDLDCVRRIHTPPRGERGIKGRWYVVTVGREVGVFCDW